VNTLAGKKILVTRPRAQAGKMIDLLTAERATAVVIPVIATLEVNDEAMASRVVGRWLGYDYAMFTSANAVHYFDLWLKGQNLPWNEALPAWVVGEKTGRALTSKNVRRILSASDAHSAEELVVSMITGGMRGKKILFPKARQTRTEPLEKLLKCGAEVDELVVYETVKSRDAAAGLRKALRSSMDWITFFSPSAVKAFFSIAETPRALSWIKRYDIKIACVGKVTSSELKRKGLVPLVECKTPSAEEMIQWMNHWEGKMT